MPHGIETVDDILAIQVARKMDQSQAKMVAMYKALNDFDLYDLRETYPCTKYGHMTYSTCDKSSARSEFLVVWRSRHAEDE
jgi:hypothetical protein